MSHFGYARLRRRRLFMGAALALLAGGAPAGAAETTPTAAVQAEVAALLADLETSACRFQRNGSWHTAAEARAHLARKWQEVQRRRLAASAEGFIEHAASRSAMTGQPYQVQCGNAPAQPSAAWLRARLQALRGAGA